MSNKISRRLFLGSVGAGIAFGISGCARFAATQPLSPAKAGVDAEKLAKAVDFIDAEIRAGSIPGAAIVATRHGRKFVEHYAGTYYTLDGGQKAYNPAVSSPLFSFSKGISATVAVMAHQDGLIDYDVPVTAYIPEFKTGGKENVTLRHLLTHSAGIPSIAGAPVLTEEDWRAFVKTVCDAPIEWPAGSRTAYHGVSGMFVVAECVRRVSGMKPWQDICRERLFAPVGAKSLSFNSLPPEIPVAIVPEYFKAGLQRNGLAGQPAGGCFGTADDMLRVLHLILQGGRWNGRTLINPEPLQEMLTVQYAVEIAKAVADGQPPAHEPWGLGWLVRGTAPKCGAAHWFGFGDSKSPTLFGHAGVDTVYGVGDPARQLAFVLIMTGKPKSADESTRIRRQVSNLLQAAVMEA